MNDKGARTRQRILSAAWELSDTMAADAVLGGLSVRDVAAAAGASPSTVTYHFPTMRDLAMAMVDHMVTTTPTTPLEFVDEMLDLVDDVSPMALFRSAAELNWTMMTSAEAINHQRRLARCYAATGAGPDGEVIRTRLEEMISAWVDHLTEVCARTAERAGVQLVEPFEQRHLARALSGMTEGLVFHAMISPGAVDTSLVSDVVAALLSAVVVPAPNQVALDERIAALTGTSAARPDTTAEDLRDAGSVAGLFASGWEGVTLTQAGRALGCSASEVAARFGTVRRLAAISFHRHLAEVEAALTRRPDAGGAVVLADGVQELARAVVRDRHCALALAHERQSAQLAPTGDDPGHDVRALVPLGAMLTVPLRDLVPGPDSKVADLADLVTDTVLTYGATHVRRPLGEITATALRLVPGL